MRPGKKFLSLLLTLALCAGLTVPALAGGIAPTLYDGSGAAPETPAQPEETPAPAVNTAYATSYSILVDGEAVAFDAYALKDESGNDTNYLKLRDVAHVLNGTAAQFNVGWDQAAQAIVIDTKG